MASLVKPGGLLAVMVPWAWRSHPTDTYGDFFRVSPSALEHLCGSSDLNPVISGGQYLKPRVIDERPSDVLDRAGDAAWPSSASKRSLIICYKPRSDRSERRVASKDYGGFI
mmetsp:Transcript_17860/g.45702  ORF Transcript_17860/g.45702 Transcript_17860/m.45702 type:complete len:112 (+) Transcript_17860:518-853(+)